MSSRRRFANRSRARLGALGVILIFIVAQPFPHRAAAQAVRDSFWVTNGTVNAVTISNSTVYIGGVFSQVGPAVGGAVAINTTSGAPELPYAKVAGWVYAVAADGNGGWYVGGAFSGAGGQARTNLAHFDPSGNVDGWDPNPDGIVQSLTVIGGTVYVGGSFANVGGQPRNRIAALDGTTGVATSWNPGCGGNIEALAPGQGTIYVGGDFTTIAGQTRFYLAELDLTTGAATAWNPNPNSSIRALMMGPFAGQICVGGFFSTIGGQTRHNLAAIDLTTGAATSWAPEPNSGAVALDFYGGTVYAGGAFSAIGGQVRNCLGAVDAVTGAATSWNPNPNGPIQALKIVLSGNIVPVVTIYVGGLFSTVGGAARNNAAAIGTSGSATSWNPNVNQTVFAMGAQGGDVYLGGRFTSVGGVARGNLAACDMTSGALLPWNPSADNTVNAMTVIGSALYVGGSFSSVGGQSRSKLAALDLTTGTATSWNPGMAGDANALLAHGSTLYVGGTFTSVGGVARNNAAAIDATSGAVLAFDPNVSSTVNAMTLRVAPVLPFTVTVYLGGRFGAVGGTARSCLAAVDGTSGALNAWNPAANDWVYALAYTSGGMLSPGTVWIGGAFTTVGGVTRRRAAAVDAGTGALKAWDPNADNIVFAILPGPGVIYLGGRFSTVGGTSRPNLASVDGGAGALTSWNPRTLGVPGQSNGFVFALAQWNGTLYAGGNFSSAEWTAHETFAGFTDPTVTAVDESAAPAVPRALLVAPNPTSSGADLRFSLSNRAEVDLTVYDVSGRLVRRLSRGLMDAGEHRVRWDGRGDRGNVVGSGVYLLRLETPTERRSSKVLVVR